ncbi:MAG: DUF1295 domain-containing protein [Alphaproteobacteria bacterium]
MTLLAPFLCVLVGMLVVMSAAWVTQRAARNAGWVDVFWTLGTGASCVAVALWASDHAVIQRQTLVAALGAIWSIRLGLYVAVRVARSKDEDARYAGLRKEWGKDFQSRMFALVIVQAPATALLTLSVLVAAHGGAATGLGLRDLLGALVLAIAIGGEGLADEQMRRFKQTPGHGRIMDRGLWAWSRHPNYFFEWIGWLAYPVIAFDIASPITWITLIAPAIMYLILRFGTGVPALEKIMLESRGDAFRDYQSRVSAFIPQPPRSPSSQRNAS